MQVTNLSSIQKDALQEIGNIGAGNAITSMAKIMNKKINMQVPSVKIITFDEMMDMIGGHENVIVAILFRIHGEISGTMYFIFSIEEAEHLVSQMVSDIEIDFLNTKSPNELAISVLQVLGNILVGSYLTALSDFTNTNMKPSIPYLSIDMAGSIVTIGLLELSQVADYAITIDTKINEDGTNNGITGYLFLLPEVEAIQKLFSSLGIKNDE